MTPALQLLRDRFPGARIDVAVRRDTQGVLEANPCIDRLFLLPRPKTDGVREGRHPGDALRLYAGTINQRYDMAFDLACNERSRLLMRLSRARRRCATNAYGETRAAESYHYLSKFDWRLKHQVLRDFHLVAGALGVEAEPGPMVFWTGDLTRERLCATYPFLADPSPYVVIHPFSRWTYKQWLPERWAEVADGLLERHGLRVVFTCGPAPAEQEQLQGILKLTRHPHEAVRGGASLRQMAGLCREARLFCGVDTVAMHIAASAQTPTVALFGPSSEWSWGPWQTQHELVLGECPCKQTRRFVCDPSCIYPCMERITSAEVLEKCGRLLEKTST